MLWLFAHFLAYINRHSKRITLQQKSNKQIDYMMKQSTKAPKRIQIQSLPPRPQPQTTSPTQAQKVQQMNWQFEWSDHPLLCYHDTGLGKERVMKSNGLFRVNSFFDCFYYAYVNHGDLLLVPDDIWIMITFYVSTYIDENAERLRKKIVRHQGVKTLTIVETVSSVEESIKKEGQWDQFFDKVVKAIQAETIKGVVDDMLCDFTTTTKTHKIVSGAIIMNSLKKYFKYVRMLAGCGINNVYMTGTRDDWTRMISKLESLMEFDVDGKLKQYIQHMRVILRNFLDTFDEKPSVQWWNTVMKTPENREIYGGDQMEVQGWILNFFGIYEKHIFMGFPQFTVKVPIKMINTLTNTEKHLLLVSDWVSVSKYNERTYKPDVGLCIFHIRSGPDRMGVIMKDIDKFKEKKKVNYQYVKMNSIMIGNPQSPLKKSKEKQKQGMDKEQRNRMLGFLSRKNKQ